VSAKRSGNSEVISRMGFDLFAHAAEHLPCSYRGDVQSAPPYSVRVSESAESATPGMPARLVHFQGALYETVGLGHRLHGAGLSIRFRRDKALVDAPTSRSWTQ
jgi:hypothetical protein